jgi:hypothetical protein
MRSIRILAASSEKGSEERPLKLLVQSVEGSDSRETGGSSESPDVRTVMGGLVADVDVGVVRGGVVGGLVVVRAVWGGGLTTFLMVGGVGSARRRGEVENCRIDDGDWE